MKDLEAKEKIEVPKEGYANLTNHYMFKRIFGSEECKDILITFLNDIMGDKVIEDVKFLPTEHLDQLKMTGKQSSTYPAGLRMKNSS